MYVPSAKHIIALPKGKIAIIAARFHEKIVDQLIAGALEALSNQQMTSAQWERYDVPGAFELPLACQIAAHRADIAGVIALGAVIRGDTPHFDYVCNACSNGILQVQLATQKPIMFGVLTTDTLDQAQSRAGGHIGNKGYDVAIGLLAMFATLENLKKSPEKTGKISSMVLGKIDA